MAFRRCRGACMGKSGHIPVVAATIGTLLLATAALGAPTHASGSLPGAVAEAKRAGAAVDPRLVGSNNAFGLSLFKRLVSGTPALIDLGHGLPSDAHIRVQPDFRYRVVYRPIDAQGIPARAALLQLDATQSDGAGLINAQMLLAKGGGTQVVGANALGRIRFSLNAANKLRAIQELYWRPDDTRPDADVYSRWTIELDADANPGGLP